ncbi:threonylcarbamoyl-AMP synthase [Eubacteriales bacterium OttesenSCG-928-K08]|nr:threonylcarbamoyl-AMP synthase [Eubacteriales bacterium OttesenSCG-928-K08]
MSLKTQVIDARGQHEAGTQMGGRIIRDGGLVAFPTETVYGLGADGLNEEAVRAIFEAKGRPADNPLILHVRSKNEVRKLWDTVPEKAQRLMDAFWPGALTLVHKKSALVPAVVTAGMDTVALRMPDNKTARALIKAADTPIAAPSANVSGRPSPTTAQHVLEDMDGKIPLIIDGGPCGFGLESTVLLIGSPPVLLRPGMVTKSMIEAVVGLYTAAGKCG